MATLEEKIAALATMSPAQLRSEWTRRFEEDASALSPSLLRLGLAYDMQAGVHGALGGWARRLIARRADNSNDRSEALIKLKPGTRLLREWNGKMHAVLVTDTGFELDGRHYRSLSQIAQSITGARWSGPRFFGLKARPRPPLRDQIRHG